MMVAGWRVTTGGEDKEPGFCGGSEGHRHAAAVTRVSRAFLLGASKGVPPAGVTRLSARRGLSCRGHSASLPGDRPRVGWQWLGLLVPSEP